MLVSRKRRDSRHELSPSNCHFIWNSFPSGLWIQRAFFDRKSPLVLIDIHRNVPPPQKKTSSCWNLENMYKVFFMHDFRYILLPIEDLVLDRTPFHKEADLAPISDCVHSAVGRKRVDCKSKTSSSFNQNKQDMDKKIFKFKPLTRRINQTYLRIVCNALPAQTNSTKGSKARA